jgi:hypothetical protein
VKRLLVLELNELNFEFVEHYARIGALPAIARVGAFSSAAASAQPIPLTELWSRMVSAF